MLTGHAASRAQPHLSHRSSGFGGSQKVYISARRPLDSPSYGPQRYPSFGGTIAGLGVEFRELIPLVGAPCAQSHCAIPGSSSPSGWAGLLSLEQAVDQAHEEEAVGTHLALAHGTFSGHSSALSPSTSYTTRPAACLPEPVWLCNMVLNMRYPAYRVWQRLL